MPTERLEKDIEISAAEEESPTKRLLKRVRSDVEEFKEAAVPHPADGRRRQHLSSIRERAIEETINFVATMPASEINTAHRLAKMVQEIL